MSHLTKAERPCAKRWVAVNIRRRYSSVIIRPVLYATDAWIKRAGLEPMKPGETRKVRIIVREPEP